MDFNAAKSYILGRLDQELPLNLYYHSPQHTRDVFEAATEIARHEEIGGEELILLQTAALYHDCGFLITYQNHEIVGCQLVTKVLPGFGYSEAQIQRICEMIMATRIPQSPQDHLGEILCDADLYYLGTQDFYQIGNGLYREFLEHGIVSNDEAWNRLQLSFLQNHEYFTQTAINLRKPQKHVHLMQVKELVESYAA
ncbi:MAG: HD domain-containing protein [Bacteroidota bacterium]